MLSDVDHNRSARKQITLIPENRPDLVLQRVDTFAEGVSLTKRVVMDQVTEHARREMREFDDPVYPDDGYSFVRHEDLNYRTIEVKPEHPGVTDDDWHRVETALSDVNLRIVQEMRNDFESTKSSFRSLRSTSQEASNKVDAYVRACLSRDGGNPETNTMMVTD